MTARLPTRLLVDALLRRTNDGGNMGMVLARGDRDAGGLLVIAVDRGGEERFLERRLDFDGRATLVDVTPANDSRNYVQRRRAQDPDLWIVELNVPEPERFIAETLGQG
ncbi:DUF1491 family protein [Sphingomonas carotinifaciens]|uniref:DUF1491 family protein n=1 Tax=Sphingomonas carotinifaciens TaxID=1166323 RepID=UPI000DD52816|nr:DUF1491 family protein [Sphingomonas carotinifaciens]